jgi:hypothetical protein
VDGQVGQYQRNCSEGVFGFKSLDLLMSHCSQFLGL